MEKKQSANWYIAATHYLTAGFVPLLVGRIIFNLFILGFVAHNVYLLSVSYFIFLMVIIWLAVMYAASYVNKKYVIKDKTRIVNLSVAYFVFINVIIANVLTALRESQLSEMIYFVVISVLLAALFYIFSKKYIKASEISQS